MKAISNFEYAKAYLEDLLLLHNVPKNLAFFLFELLNYVNIEKQIIINSFIKKKLAEKTNLSKGTIDNALTKFNDSGLLIRLDRGVYIPHPVLLELPKLLQGTIISLKVTYSKNKREIEPM